MIILSFLSYNQNSKESVNVNKSSYMELDNVTSVYSEKKKKPVH